MHIFATSVIIGILAFVLGIAIQRGSTCAVSAVHELIYRRRADMFVGFFECSLWALLIVWLANTTTMVPDWASVLWLCTGAAIFGVGAVINDGCAFGSIARLGKGRLDYLLTGFGVWLAYFLFDHFGMVRPSEESQNFSDVYLWMVFLGLPSLILLRWWIRPRPMQRLLRLSLIMATIGICGSLLAMLNQPWPWTRALHHIENAKLIGSISFCMLLAGSIFGGLSAGHFRPKRPHLTDLRDRLTGGLMMGSASVIIPGGNDSFILYGLSSGDGEALLGYLVMLLSIAITLVAFKRLAAS